MNKKISLPLFLLICSTTTQPAFIPLRADLKATPDSLLKQCTIDAGKEEDPHFRLEILDAISSLLKVKADPSKKINGVSALEIARQSNHNEVLFLFEHQVTMLKLNSSLLIAATAIANLTRNVTNLSPPHHSTIDQIFKLLDMNANPALIINRESAFSVAQAAGNNEILGIFKPYLNK